MIDTICLDENYSTTRLTTQEKPEISNNTDDKFETVLFLPESEGRKGEGGLRTKGYFKKSYSHCEQSETISKPLISIITVVYNGEQFLEETIQSVINQTYENVEYIIIDGGSTDGTLDIIKKYEDRIDYWVSEKDKGIYDAMNKGITVCLGEIVGIINADDFYFNENIFLKIAQSFIKTNGDVYYGNIKIIKQNTKDIIEERYTNENKLYYGMYLNHPATFVRLKTYKRLGLFDTKIFKMAADYDFILRNKVNKSKFICSNEFLAYMRDGGASIKNIELTQQETRMVRKKNLGTLTFYMTNTIKFIRKMTK